ncbi:hypothetical protein [Streptomyces sp. MUM 16J]
MFGVEAVAGGVAAFFETGPVFRGPMRNKRPPEPSPSGGMRSGA